MNLNLHKREKDIITGLLVIGLFFLYTNVLSNLPIAIAGVNFKYAPLFVKILYYVTSDILLIAIYFLIYHKTLKKDFKDYKKNFSQYVDVGIKYWITGVIVMALSSYILNLFLNTGVADNEQAVRSLIQAVPFYMLFSTGIYAPIIEELTFRKAFKDIIGKNIFFVFLSGIVFGGMHVVFSANSFIDYFQIIPYSSVGVALAYMYYKTDNILVPMSMHFVHNFGATLLIMVLGL